ncbi:MAG: uroporphyrinogen decarboxylase family protein [Saccharofermentanales bacterium]
MNSKERVLCALNHNQPDRVPTDYQAVSEVNSALYNHFKTDDFEDVLQKLEIDCRWIGPSYNSPKPEIYNDGSFMGWGGSISRIVTNKYGAYTEIVKYALDDIETVKDIDEKLKLPDLDDFDFNDVTEKCRRFGEYFIISGMASTFYYPTLVRSMENIFIDMATEPELAHHLIKKIVDWHLDYHDRLLDAGNGRIDAMQIADDFSTQMCPLISQSMFDEFFIDNIKSFSRLGKSYGAKIFFHCCGSAYKFIPSLLDAGIEILDPVQTTAANMEPDRLKREFGDRLSFHGAAETQHIIPNGTPEQVRENARDLVRILGKDGGFILSSCHCLQADVPVENVLALYDINNR